MQDSERARKSGYFFRQLLWSTLAVLLPVLAMLVYVQYDVLQATIRHVEASGVAQANEAARNTDRALGRINGVLDFLLSQDEVRKLDPQRCNTFLSGFYSADLLLRNIVILDEQGNTLCAANRHPELPRTAIGLPWYVEAARQSGRHLSQPYIRASDKAPGLVITDFVRDAAKRPIGMVVAAIDVERFSSVLLKPYDLPPGSIVSVIDSQDRLVARYPEVKKFFGERVRQTPHDILHLPEAVPVYRGVDDVYRVRTVTALTNGGWRLFVGIPVKGLFTGVWRTGTTAVTMVIVSGLFCFAVAWYNARRLARPAQELAEVARRYGQGDRSARASHHLPGEFGLVGHELTAMMEALEQAERERVETARLRAESQAKTDFLARMSHELRTPLNSVLGFSRLLQESALPQLDSTQAQHLSMVFEAGQQLSALIDDALDMARIESRQLAVNFQNIDPIRPVLTTLRMCEGQAAAAGVRLEQHGLDVRLPRIRTDPLRLQQILLNLLNNAIKYNRPNGSVTVTVNSLDKAVEVQVADTGMGMSDEQLSKAFEPFNRLGRESSGIPGTGIGLTLTKQLVELLEGTLELSSMEGLGTRAVLTLPRSDSLEPPSGQEGASPLEVVAIAAEATEPEGTLLYVEDMPMNVSLVQALVRPLSKVNLVVAENGRKGVEAALALHPDLILLDMQLPDIHGLDVLMQLRFDPRTQDIPIVALSASAMADEVARARSAGANDYWAKPIQFELFREGIKDWMGRPKPPKDTGQA